MEIYLLRHGEATSKESNPERPLTPEGRNQVLVMGRWLAVLGVKFTRVISSSKKRALETACLVAGETGFPVEKIVTDDRLLPESNGEEILGILQSFAEEEKILVVGHLPSLAEAAAGLVGAGCIFRFAEAGLCRIDWQKDRDKFGVLVWLLHPQLAYLRK